VTGEGHDVWRRGKGLGPNCQDIYEQLGDEPRTVGMIRKDVPWPHSSTIRYALRRLGAHGLAAVSLERRRQGRGRPSVGWIRGSAELDIVAAVRGVLGRTDRDRAQYAHERKQWHAYLRRMGRL